MIANQSSQSETSHEAAGLSVTGLLVDGSHVGVESELERGPERVAKIKLRLIGGKGTGMRAEEDMDTWGGFEPEIENESNTTQQAR